MEQTQESKKYNKILDSIKPAFKDTYFFSIDPITNAINVDKKHLSMIFKQANKKNQFVQDIDEMTMPIEELRKKLKSVNHELTESDLQFFTQSSKDVTLIELYEFLCSSNEYQSDPMMDLFKNFSDGDKFCQQKFNQMAQLLGYQELDKQSMRILTDALDCDKDGVISVKDLQLAFEVLLSKEDENQ